MSNKHHKTVIVKTPAKVTPSKELDAVAVEQDSRICLEPSVTDYQAFIKTTYKVMGITEKKPSKENVKKSVQLLLS